ncbi:MAG: hypothetical protein JSW73_04130 [Candidatus Woesearchaeota archaeon]|nr:MAG: hypothetical protein JSW73_04130 [Candidatus Woesearchaeota archaeon]
MDVKKDAQELNYDSILFNIIYNKNKCKLLFFIYNDKNNAAITVDQIKKHCDGDSISALEEMVKEGILVSGFRRKIGQTTKTYGIEDNFYKFFKDFVK